MVSNSLSPVSEVAICFLLVNKVRELPELAIRSCRSTTEAPIYLGYIDSQDLPDLSDLSDIYPLKLDPNQVPGLSQMRSEGSSYRDFADEGFYQIVQLKWQLLLKVLDKDVSSVIYSDTDVFWNKSPLEGISSAFDKRKNVEIQIQSFTENSGEPRLCMGFVAIRNSDEAKAILMACKNLHLEMVAENSKCGDDDVMTHYFRGSNFTNSILELPQMYFPVGIQLNLFRGRDSFPGLRLTDPYIFHANYVTGLRNKRLLMRLFVTRKDRKFYSVTMSPSWQLLLMAKRFRLQLARFRKFFNLRFPRPMP